MLELETTCLKMVMKLTSCIFLAEPSPRLCPLPLALRHLSPLFLGGQKYWDHYPALPFTSREAEWLENLELNLHENNAELGLRTVINFLTML